MWRQILRRHEEFFANLQISKRITLESWLFSNALPPSPFKSSTLLKWQDLPVPSEGMFWSMHWLLSSTGIRLIFQLHILLPPPHCYLGLACEAQKQGTRLQTPLEGLTPSSLSAKKPSLASAILSEKALKKAASLLWTVDWAVSGS